MDMTAKPSPAVTRRDTIVALSSGTLPAGVAVIRLSGPTSRFVLETISGRRPEPRVATLSTLRTQDGAVLDQALVVFFPAPHSFTGEDVAEFHLHGGRAVVAAVFKAISALTDCRLAEPGEFTRRAFLNGKIDLLSAEATADLINAETEAQRRLAALNASGGHASLYAEWRRRLVHARAMIEADLDFADEGDVPGSVANQVWSDVTMIAEDLRRHILGFGKAELVQDGYRVVLLGAPNAGKSSLLNVLARRDAAIVTDEPGTTRDTVDVALDLEGHKVIVTDTAGLRKAEGKAESIGVERSLERASRADLVLVVEDLCDPNSIVLPELAADILWVGNKLDIVQESNHAPHDFLVSTVDGEGVEELVAELGRRAASAAPRTGELLPWKQRHVDLLTSAMGSLETAASATELPIELRCEELRAASDAIGRIAGAVDVEDLLDVIFSQFCIGK